MKLANGGLRNEKIWSLIELIIFTFTWLAFSENIAGLYSLMVVADYFILDIFNLRGELRIMTNAQAGNTPKSVVKGVIAYAVFLLVAWTSMFFFQSGGVSSATTFNMAWQAVLGTFSQAAPPLANNPIAVLIVFGILIARRETILWCRVFDIASSKLRIPLEMKEGRLWILITALSGAFMAFHIAVRAITDQLSWFLTFAFMFVTLTMLSLKPSGERREMESAIYLHIINNSLAVLNKMTGFAKSFL